MFDSNRIGRPIEFYISTFNITVRNTPKTEFPANTLNTT